jgi:hypothetical protein
MYRIAAESSGVLAFDVCSFNRAHMRADSIAGRLASQFPGGSVSVVDQQTWYVAELPHTLPEPRG